MEHSPFRQVPESDWIASNRSGFALSDAFPVSEGHALVIPFRQISTWWEAESVEQADLMALVGDVKLQLEKLYQPDGFNVGFNSGQAAGQTINHLHLHVIPRYAGDVTDPRGGIRHVIPGRGNYLEKYQDGQIQQGRLKFLDGGTEGRMRAELTRCLRSPAFDRIDLVVSFIMLSGLDIVRSGLRDAIDRGARVRILTTDYLDITDPDALAELLDICDELDQDRKGLEVRLWKARTESFHPKAYLFRSSNGNQAQGFVGSSNLSRSGIDGGIEWNLGTTAVDDLVQSFDQLWSHDSVVELTHDFLREYRSRRRLSTNASTGHDVSDVVQELPRQVESPTPIQVEALEALNRTRSEGFTAGLVVMATGLGKTWLAAFDSSDNQLGRTLFVAHREEILAQSRDVFRRVRPDADMGLYFGKEKSPDADVVFASVQTLSRHLSEFEPDAFDYVVVDEFHHAAASSYRNLIEYFTPTFLLGLTATPDRMDGADLLALCGDNLVYDCNLVEGIRRAELVPFRYQGLKDLVDFEPIPWRNGKFDPESLADAVETIDRAEQSLDAWREYGGGPTLGFCVSITHAEFMATHFGRNGVRAIAVHSGPGSAPRGSSIEELRNGSVDVIFTVDLFNEGLDVPEIETVLMLRPTDSPIVFLQQLGRGLRKSDGKDFLRVVDFIGNHRSFLNRPRTLLSLGGREFVSQRQAADAARTGDFNLPEGCSVVYELEAVDLLESLARSRPSKVDALADYCRDFFDDYGYRPTALQAYLMQLNPRRQKAAEGSWFGLLRDLNILTPDEVTVVEQFSEVLTAFIREEASKSYKLVTLRALIAHGYLREPTPVSDLCAWSRSIVLDDPRLIADTRNDELGDPSDATVDGWERYWTKWPVSHLAGSKASALFKMIDGQFRPTFAIPEALGPAFDSMISEIVEWRLAEYLLRPSVVGGESGEIRCRVSHSGGNPIIRLERSKYPQLPTEPTTVMVGGAPVVFNFVKIAVNVAQRPGEVGNALHSILRGWFGPSAGWPGTRHEVIFEETPGGWTVRPVGGASSDGQLIPLFPTFEVACGLAEATEPVQSGSVIQITEEGTLSVDPDRNFVVFAQGESMAGGTAPIHHGDALLFEWTRDVGRGDLVGERVLIQQKAGELSKAYLKRLARVPGGFELASDNPAELPVLATSDMRVIAHFIQKLDQREVNPLSSHIGELRMKPQVAELYGATYGMGPWMMSGHVRQESDEILFVTLDKKGMSDDAQYEDHFDGVERFVWSSQNQTAPESNQGRNILESPGNGQKVHLWVRRTKKDPFEYCGLVLPISHEGSMPMSVNFRLMTPLSKAMIQRYGS